MSADPYAEPGSFVLRNKLGLRDEQALKEIEYQASATRAAQLHERPITGRFDFEHLKAIHAHLFQDVYDWAGQVRTVNLSKGSTSFARADFIEPAAKQLSAALAGEHHLQGLQKPAFVERLAHHFAEWNALHPFREGNGRSLREFVGQLARHAGYELDQARIDNDKGQWNEAARRSFNGDLTQLREIFAQAVRPSRALAFEQLPEPEALARHPELKPAYERLRTTRYAIAERFPGNDKAQERYLEQARSEIVRKLDTGEIPQPAIERPAAAPAEPPARARAFQAVADNQLTRDEALKRFPELREAFHQLLVANLKHKGDPQPVQALRTRLQTALNAGEIPAPTRAGPTMAPQRDRGR